MGRAVRAHHDRQMREQGRCEPARLGDQVHQRAAHDHAIGMDRHGPSPPLRGERVLAGRAVRDPDPGRVHTPPPDTSGGSEPSDAPKH